MKKRAVGLLQQLLPGSA